MYIHVIFNPNQVKKPQGNKVVQYFKILNSVYHDMFGIYFNIIASAVTHYSMQPVNFNFAALT